MGMPVNMHFKLLANAGAYVLVRRFVRVFSADSKKIHSTSVFVWGFCFLVANVIVFVRVLSMVKVLDCGNDDQIVYDGLEDASVLSAAVASGFREVFFSNRKEERLENGTASVFQQIASSTHGKTGVDYLMARESALTDCCDRNPIGFCDDPDPIDLSLI